VPQFLCHRLVGPYVVCPNESWLDPARILLMRKNVIINGKKEEYIFREYLNNIHWGNKMEANKVYFYKIRTLLSSSNSTTFNYFFKELFQVSMALG